MASKSLSSSSNTQSLLPYYYYRSCSSWMKRRKPQVPEQQQQQQQQQHAQQGHRHGQKQQPSSYKYKEHLRIQKKSDEVNVRVKKEGISISRNASPFSSTVVVAATIFLVFLFACSSHFVHPLRSVSVARRIRCSKQSFGFFLPKKFSYSHQHHHHHHLKYNVETLCHHHGKRSNFRVGGGGAIFMQFEEKDEWCGSNESTKKTTGRLLHLRKVKDRNDGNSKRSRSSSSSSMNTLSNSKLFSLPPPKKGIYSSAAEENDEKIVNDSTVNTSGSSNATNNGNTVRINVSVGNNSRMAKSTTSCIAEDGEPNGTASSATAKDDDDDDYSHGKNKNLSRQEEILASLGMGVETDEEKAMRISKREEAQASLRKKKQLNLMVAIGSVLVAVANYIYQYLHPVTAIQLLTEMQATSSPVTDIGRNGKPTVVDFWAPWCENCKAAAPTLHLIETEYRNRVNFIMVNGDLMSSLPLIDKFGVDAIPHLALVSSEGDVETALIGPIPSSVLRADLDVMLENAAAAALAGSSGGSSDDDTRVFDYCTKGEKGCEEGNENMVTTTTTTQQKKKIELPYTMYDAFRTHPQDRRVLF